MKISVCLSWSIQVTIRKFHKQYVYWKENIIFGRFDVKERVVSCFLNCTYSRLFGSLDSLTISPVLMLHES